MTRLLRTKTGCINCRLRKIKCDEFRPECKQCTRAGWTCNGYADHRLRLPRQNHASISIRTRNGNEPRAPRAIMPAPSRSPLNRFRNEEDSRCFEFFCSSAIPQTNRLVDSPFWSELVLQMSVDESAVKSCILSLGALQRHLEFKQGQERLLAISYYGQAVHDAQELAHCASITGDPTKVLVCAILLHCVENALGNYISAKNHLRSGTRLLYETRATPTEFPIAIFATYQRFDFQAMTFWAREAPYEFFAPIWKRLEATCPPGQFQSLNEATNVLMDLAQWFHYIGQKCWGRFYPLPRQLPGYAVQVERCRAYIETWNDRFQEFKVKHGTYLPDFRRRCTLLSIYYLFISSEVRFRFAGPERQWDAELPNFSWILNLAEIIIEGESSIFARGVNSHELGLTMPLLQTAVRCRDPYLRRRAVAMMRAPRREGSLDSLAAAKAAQSIIDIEEEGLVKVEKADDIPEAQRVHFLDPAADLERRQAVLTFYMRPRLVLANDGQARYVYSTREETITW